MRTARPGVAAAVPRAPASHPPSSRRRRADRAEPGAGRADRRPRLHPERPVRAVLPRRPGRLLRRGRARRRRSRTRSTPTSSRSSARASSTSGSPTARASSRRSARASRSSTSRRSTGSSRRSCSPRRRRASTTAADLAGKKLGHPGPLRLVVDHAPGAARRRPDLTPDDLEIVEYPDFGQGAAVAQGAVDAATGFANNEPVQLELTGEEVTSCASTTIVPLPGNGLIVGDGDARVEARRDRRRSSPRPCGRWRRSPRTPTSGLDAAIVAVPELGLGARHAGRDPRRDDRGLDGDRSRRHGGLGAIEPADWEASIAYLTTLGLVPNPVTVDDLARHRPAAGAGADRPMLGGVRPSGARRSWWLREALAAEAAAVAPPGRGRAAVAWHDDRRRRHRRWRLHRAVDRAPPDRAGAAAPGSCCSRRTSAAAARPGATAGSSRTGGTSCRRSSSGTARTGALAMRRRRWRPRSTRSARSAPSNGVDAWYTKAGSLVGQRRAGPGRRAGPRPSRRCAAHGAGRPVRAADRGRGRGAGPTRRCSATACSCPARRPSSRRRWPAACGASCSSAA